MPFIAEKDRGTLRDRLKRELKSEVKLRLFTQRTFGLTIPGRECLHCEDTQKLMGELVELSPKLKLEVVDYYSHVQAVKEAGVERIPALVMSTDGSTNVKFYGIPLGLEFAALLETIVTLSRGVSPLALETRKKLKQIKDAVHIQVFVTPTCGYCPQVARAAHALAMDNPKVRTDVVEIQEFPLLAQRYQVSGVPKTVINNKVQFVGAVPESMLMDYVLKAVGVEAKEQQPSAVAVAPEVGPATRTGTGR